MASPPDPALSERPWVTSYPPGVPPTYRLPTVRLPRLLEDAARDFPEHTALEFGRRQLTYAQLQERVVDLAARLHTLPGVAPAMDGSTPLEGAHVLVRLPDGLAGPIVLFALWRAGAVAVPVDLDAPRQQVEQLIRRLGVIGVIAEGRLLRRLELPDGTFALEVRGDEWDVSPRSRLLRRLPSVPKPKRRRQRRGSDADLVEGDADPTTEVPADADRAENAVASIHDLLAVDPGRVPLAGLPTATDAPALVAVRRGGRELAVTHHTHATLLATAFQSRLWVPDIQAGRERVFIAEPINDIVGNSVGLLAAVLSGATSILMDRADGPLSRQIEQSQPTLLIGRSAHIADLGRYLGSRRRDLTSLRVCLAIGDGLLPHEARELERRARGARVRPLHGIGDAAPLAHGQPVYGRVVPTSIGLPVTSTLAVVVDPQDLGVLREPDEPGRLLLRGPQVAERTDDEHVVDGWLVTDLMARADEAGWFTIIGGVDEVVDVGGRVRSPARIAEQIRRDPTVRDVEVVEVDGALVAAVTGVRRKTPDPDVLRESLALYLGVPALPDDIVVVQELPHTGFASGALDLPKLQELIRAAQLAATLHTEGVPATEDASGGPPDGGRPGS